VHATLQTDIAETAQLHHGWEGKGLEKSEWHTEGECQ
jgi:hypothetical protein